MLSRFAIFVVPGLLALACVGEDLNKRGEKGEQGPQGQPGPAGQSCFISDSRADGLSITCGEGSNLTVMDIPFGKNGKDGKDGADGASGKSCELVQEKPEFIEIACPKADGTMTTLMIKNGINGSQGEKGEKGDKGDKGDKGEQGATGDVGLTGNSCVVTERSGAVEITCGSSTVIINIDQKVCEASGGIFQNGSCQKSLPLVTNETASVPEPAFQPGQRRKVFLRNATRDTNGRFCFEDYRGNPDTDKVVTGCSRSEFTAGCYNPSIKTILWFPNADAPQYKACKAENKVLASDDVQQLLMALIENNWRAYNVPAAMQKKFCTATAKSDLGANFSTSPDREFIVTQGSQFVINGYRKVGRTSMYLAIKDASQRWIQWDAPLDLFDLDCPETVLLSGRRAIFVNQSLDLFADITLTRKVCVATPGFIHDAQIGTFTDQELVIEGPQVEAVCKARSVFAAPSATDRLFSGFLK